MGRAARYLTAIVVLVVPLQLSRFPRSNPPVESDLGAPPEVKETLRRACYDCHSNQTRWPWYGDFAPVSWLVHHDVSEGRRRLNFSTWAAYADDPGTKAQKLAEIARFVEDGDMAPWYYRLLHPEAHLDDAQRRLISRWVKAETASLPPF
jgi:Haem-binding domain